MAIDGVTLQILANHCAAATESMAHTLVRTAHSTFVKEQKDFPTVWTTVAGKPSGPPFDLGRPGLLGLTMSGHSSWSRVMRRVTCA